MTNPTAVSSGDDVLAAWGNQVVSRVVPIYATAAARAIAMPTPEAGQLSYLANEKQIEVYLGGFWLRIGGPSLKLADPNGTKIAGGLFGRAVTDSGIDLWGTLKIAEFSDERTTLHRRLTVTDGHDLVDISKDGGGKLRFDVFGLPVSGGAENVRFDSFGGTPTQHRFSVTSSSAAHKSDIATFDDPTVVDRLRPVTFLHDDGNRYLGFIAEEVAHTLPLAADTVVDQPGQVVNYDLRAVAAALVSKIHNLEGRLAALEAAAS